MSDDTKKESTTAEVKSEDPKADAAKEVEASSEKDSDTAMTEAEKEEAKKKEEEERKEKDKLKKKYANWPLKGIKDPHENDVMYGRGGGTNHHPGNKEYRKMVEDRKLEYVNSKRLDKPLVALEIIRLWRGQLPPGRFLKLDEKTGLWNDVGDKKAREKTSQALREKAPLIRKQQEEEKEKEEGVKSKKETRFATGTKTESSSKAEKPLLARDHSLGREYLQDGEAVSVEGFSWRDPFLPDSEKRNRSFGSAAAPMPPAAPGVYPPAGRHSSSGSLGIAPPQHGAPPPPPDYYGRVGSANQLREYSTGRIESWGSYAYPPPPPPPAVHGPSHQRSGSWTYNHAQPPPPAAPGHQRSGSWGGREHSLAFNPLIGASVSHPADRGTFGPPQQYWAPGPYRSPPRQLSPTNSTPSPKPSYNVNMDIARTWSGGAESAPKPGWMEQRNQPYSPAAAAAVPGASPVVTSDSFVPKPQMVKRDTSHQAENVETKHQVKRAALNRDSSMTSNRLKAQYMPEYYNGKFNSESEVNKLTDNLEQSKLSPKRLDATTEVEPTTAKPESLKDSDRLTTLDINEILSKPEPLAARTSTIEALGIDLENESMFDAPIVGGGIPRPNAMTTDNRLTTNEIFELVNADPEDLVKGDDPPPLNQETVAGW